MEYRSTNPVGFVHFGGDVVSNVHSSHGVQLSGGSTGGIVETVSDDTAAALTVRAKGAGRVTLGNSSNTLTLAGSSISIGVAASTFAILSEKVVISNSSGAVDINGSSIAVGDASATITINGSSVNIGNANSTVTLYGKALTLGNSSASVDLNCSSIAIGDSSATVTISGSSVVIGSTTTLVKVGNSTTGIKGIQQYLVPFTEPDLAASTEGLSTAAVTGLTTGSVLVFVPHLPVKAGYVLGEARCSTANELVLHWINMASTTNSGSSNTGVLLQFSL